MIAVMASDLCECGCGETVTEGRRFRLGHAARVRWAGHTKVGPRHGTLNGYAKHGCRCEDCRVAWRDHQREYMKRRRALRRFAPDPKPALIHGRITTYVRQKCRCNECRAVHAAQARARRVWARKMSAFAPEKRTPIPSPSVCPVCDHNYWNVKSEKGSRYCSNLCAVKAWREAQARRRVASSVVSDRDRRLYEQLRCEEVAAARSASDALASLLDDQEKDAQRYIVGERWMVSLDSYAYEDVTWYEVIGLKGSDEWTLAVIHKVDRQREIDAWAEDSRVAVMPR